MRTTALWNTDARLAPFPALDRDLSVDVAIVGGGITGITTAQQLAAAGLDVVVLEAHSVGGGTTGQSTGNLYATVDSFLYLVRSKYDSETVGVVVRARTAAMGLIEHLVHSLKVECRFERAPFYLISESDDHDTAVEEEHNAALEAGLRATLVDTVPLPPAFVGSRILRIEDQAQLDPLAYTRGLADALRSTCKIYEHTKVTAFDEAEGVCTLRTAGGTITARHVVMATHSPKGTMFVQTLLGPYREYGVAARLEASAYPPPGIYWTLTPEHKVSVRSYRDAAGEMHIIAVGEPHKVGQEGDNRPLVARLEQFLRDRFDVAEVTHRWGAQHYRPADLLPYIGRRDHDSNVFVATGFSADGLVGGTLAAMLIAEEIRGIENVWAKTFAFGRHHPFKAAAAFIKENANVALQYLKALPQSVDVDHFAQIPQGEGRIISVDGHRCAAFRHDSGKLEVVSAVCPHLAGIVRFNEVEKTWDCPMHGSRFRTDGSAIEGPAIDDLARLSDVTLARELAKDGA